MFSGVLSVGKVEFTDKLPTAATNGRDVLYNPEFLTTLDEKELTFVVLHEALHKVFQHMYLWRKLWKESPQLANMAADYVVNYTIHVSDPSQNVAKIPESALFDMRFADMSTKQVYDILKQEAEKSGKVSYKTKGGKGQEESEGKQDHHDWEGAEDLSEDEVKEVKRQIDQALRQGEIIRGKMEGNRNRAIDGLLEPKVDWREQLREFVNATCRNKDKSSWRRPSRRFIGQDIYMPSLIGEAIGKIVVAIDTSGSINDEILRELLTEVVAICKDVTPESVELLYWDTHVAAHETYRIGDYDGLATTTKPAGGGGTHVGCVNDYIKEHKLNPEAVIVLTDGYVESDWGGNWEWPTLWAVTSNLQSPHGKTIRLEI